MSDLQRLIAIHRQAKPSQLKASQRPALMQPAVPKLSLIPYSTVELLQIEMPMAHGRPCMAKNHSDVSLGFFLQ